MLSRRALLVGMGACGFSSSAVGITLGCQTNAWPTDPQRFESVLSVLKKIRELGFAGFETGFRNLQSQTKHPDAARGQIESTGLEFFGVHIFLSQYDPQTRIAPAELYEKVAESAVKLGARWLILSGAPAPAGTGLADKAAALDRAGAFAKKLGLKLAYHNHDKEFRNSAQEMRALLRRTDPQLTSFLLDAGHALRGGADVPSFLEEAHRRIAALHLRDFRGGKQVPLGSGDFPLQQVAATLKRVGWRGWALAEEEREDGSKPGEQAIRPAIDALRKYFG